MALICTLTEDSFIIKKEDYLWNKNALHTFLQINTHQRKESRTKKQLKHFTFSHTLPRKKPGNRIIYLSFHRAKIVALKEGIHITPARFYRAINELIDANTIARTEFKYQYILNPAYFRFLKTDPT
ncbi:hypothetical protein ACWKYK_03450 [Enterobacter hormaechei]